MNKLAGRRGITKDWSTDSGSEEEDQEEVAETGSKGSMNRPSVSNKVQSDAETEHSTQRRQTDKADAKRLLNGRKRYAIMLQLPNSCKRCALMVTLLRKCK